MDDNSTDRRFRLGFDSSDLDGVQNPLVVGVKLFLIFMVVTILSLGVVGCSVFFIYMCFVHPEAAMTLLPIIIPATVTALVTHFGTKAVMIAKTKEPEKKIGE